MGYLWYKIETFYQHDQMQAFNFFSRKLSHPKKSQKAFEWITFGPSQLKQ